MPRRSAAWEYPNLAYLTKSGSPTGPPNPIQLNGASFTATNDWLLMNQGDKLTVSIHDSKEGLQTVINDSRPTPMDR